MQRILVRMKLGATLGFCLFLLSAFALPASGQCPFPNAFPPSPLCLSNNYFVTGDYVVGGVGLRGLGGGDGFATGLINIPDTMQAEATGVASPSVPQGAYIVAAFLYWETVESTSSVPPHPGQNGFFNTYPITGTIRGNPNAPTSWSSGGCSGSSKGTKTIVAYRADVRPFLPLDANGNAQGNGSFQVRLPDSGSNGGGVPLTLGASLVIVYKVLNPAMPLNSIVIYDGAFAPSNQTTNSEMMQTMTGFYQAAVSTPPVTKLTHIVGDGQSNKSESVMLNSVGLPSLYPAFPGVAFPGIYNGSWDNATWTGANSAINTALQPGDSSVTTFVNPGSGSTGSGCVDWGAVIFSTTVQDTDGDGLLDIWESNHGYTDAITGQFVALPGADPAARDIFVEADYLSNLDGLAGPYLHSHLPKQQALDMIGDAFVKQNTHLHFDVGANYAGNCSITTGACPDPYIIQNGSGGNSISESVTVCNDSPGVLCQFPSTPSVGWKDGFVSVKSNPTVTINGTNFPLGNFQFGRKDSYHYILFGHALGAPTSFWTSFANTQASSFYAKLDSITNSGNTATVVIHTPQGIVKPGDCPNAAILMCSNANSTRVSVGGALGQPALNGTYPFTITNVAVDGNNVTTTTFTIPTSGLPAGTQTYNFNNEPRLVVTYLGPFGSSGQSDFPGGGDSAVTFGLWGADDAGNCQGDPSQPLTAQHPTYCSNQMGTVLQQAGTIMHEMGHTLTLAHGGIYFDDQNNPSVPTFEANCKPNFLSIMSYLFQVRGFPDGGIDYSGQRVKTLDESMLNEPNGIGLDLDTNPNQSPAHLTSWYAPPNATDTKVGHFAAVHCDGTPITDGAQMVRLDGSIPPWPQMDWNNNLIVPDAIEPVSPQDANFDGVLETQNSSLRGFNDWKNIDLLQLGSRENALGFSSGGIGIHQVGGGGGIGIHQVGGGGGIAINQVGGGGGIGIHQVGGGGGTEQDEDTAFSSASVPTGLNCKMALGTVPACTGSTEPFNEKGKSVPLNWSAPSTGQTRKYFVWRAIGNFPTLQSVLANTSSFTNLTPLGITNKSPNLPPSPIFLDPNVRNGTTYTYFVTDTNKQGATSGASTPLVVLVSF